jgi:TRAP-type C4-dicarboxylate transport system permease large subunit
VADTSALGSMLIPAMERQGYTRRFAAAVTAASSVIGPIIPPSGIMIIYAYVMGESVAALFLAGIVPGILVGVGLMLVVKLMANRYNLPKAERIVKKGQTLSPREYWASFLLLRLNLGWMIFAIFRAATGIASGEDAGMVLVLGTYLVGVTAAHLLLVSLRSRVDTDFRMVTKRAVVPLQTPILILGGILLGVFTPTEAAAVAVFYAVIVAFFVLKTMKLSDVPEILSRSAMTSAVVLLLVGAAMAFKTVVSLSYAPQILAEYILALSENPLILLFLINILLFIVGMFLDAGPAIIILGPILGPIFVEMGVHPVHFAIIMSVNLTVGLATPPMGLVLFVASSVANEKVETIARAILPFLAVEVLVIFLITYIPAISMTVPRLTGFIN